MVATGTGKSGPKNLTTFERKSDLELLITRSFDGPARIVFDAWTRPELLRRWWAPCSLGVSLIECDADVRVGGAFSGMYREVTPHSRLVYTSIFEPMRAAGEAIVTATLSEHAGKTRLELHSLYPSKAALDGAVGAGMEHGARETMDQLETLVASLR